MRTSLGIVTVSDQKPKIYIFLFSALWQNAKVAWCFRYEGALSNRGAKRRDPKTSNEDSHWIQLVRIQGSH